MKSIRVGIILGVSLIAMSVAAADQPKKEKLPSQLEARVSQLELELKTLREANEASLRAADKLSTENRENAKQLTAMREQSEFHTKLLAAISSNEPKWTDISTAVIAVLALCVSIFAWKINKQVAWFTGAMESHSTKRLMLDVMKEKNITLRWWDPYAKGPQKEWPLDATVKHEEKIQFRTMYIGLPEHLRTKHSCFVRLAAWASGVWKNLRTCIKGAP